MVIAIIPARYSSSRFPGKPLAMIAGKPMVQHVYERVTQATKISGVYVATDDERIEKVVREFGGEVIMTHPAHRSGTDRVAEAADGARADIIVNVQGDEPLIDPRAVDQIIEPMLSAQEIDVATPIKRITSYNEIANPNIAKVVLGERNRALYFSRAGIPFLRDVATEEWATKHAYWKHVGMYAFRREALERFAAAEQTDLERAEQLEQLRLLALGEHIHCVETEFEAIAVDWPEDIAKVEQRLVVE